MERVTFTNSRNGTLVGNLYPSLTQTMIIMCHGFISDKSSRGRFDRLSQTFAAHGYGVLAFDFSGCGESHDDRLTLAKLVDDLRSAIRFVKANGYAKIALYGHSLGGRVCLEAFSPQDISTIVMTGPGTGPIRYNWNEHFSETQWRQLRECGYLTVSSNSTVRKNMTIDKQMLLDFEQFSQETLLKRITCPVLIMHGDGGWEEPLLADITRQGMKWLTADSQLVIVEGADHSFMDHLHVVERLAVEWFSQYFPVEDVKSL
ncbi:alpha/beta hydrolase [Brevibacillus humidisoli]|uniref:alpha/beta hydrolase family protein n=1 Tax=Brevibacillus humidisoli TaxID=2895522 RepID=UPI001E352120|nr:alpha/beta hydrolase [Brevibacillus humidisoli]UFJ41662.1 alpha/beta hydrolase [Brevibacillus humidisoli]